MSSAGESATAAAAQSSTSTSASAPASTSTSTSAPSSGNGNNNDSLLISKLTMQVRKLTDANAKYKNLLKLAKERIQQQEEQLEEFQTTHAQLQIQLANLTSNSNSHNNNTAAASTDAFFGESTASATAASTSTTTQLASSPLEDGIIPPHTQIVRVCQRVHERQKQSSPSTASATTSGSKTASGTASDSHYVDTIWVLLELAPQRSDQDDVVMTPNASSSASSFFYIWKSFRSEASLTDFLHTQHRGGEPLQLPSVSLTADQSTAVQHQSQQAVAAVTEEFRRFRVKAELQRKQADQLIQQLTQSKKQSDMARLLQQNTNNNSNNNNNTHSTQPQDERHPHPQHQHRHQHQQPSAQSSAQQAVLAREKDHTLQQLAQLRQQYQTQEAYWKAEYDTLLEENNALKTAGSEALLASQWRQRYETLLQEKHALAKQLQNLQESEKNHPEQQYEAKYKDLKESFRLYRKKAKEIFETHPPTTLSTNANDPMLVALADSGSADAKLGYLRNLMVQYLTAEDDSSIKNPMEAAIGTILQFTPTDVQRIDQKRAEKEAWF